MRRRRCAVLRPARHRALLAAALALLAGTPPATAAEVVVGMSAAFTGPSKSLGLEFFHGAQAYLEGWNAVAGAQGRKLRIRARDDGYEPAPALENTLAFLADPEVTALFGYVGTPTVTRILPLLKRHGGSETLLFFAFTGAQPLRRPPYGDLVFNLRASYADETAGLVDRFAAVGRTKVGIFYQADAYGRSGWSGVREALRERGLGIAAEATYRRGTPFEASFARQVELLAEVDVVISVGSYEACGGFIRDARDGGLEAPIANVSFVGSERLLELLQGISGPGRDYTRMLVNSQVVPSYQDTSLEAVREYRSALESYDPAPPEGIAPEPASTNPYSYVSFEGFLSAKLLTRVLGALRPGAGRAELRAAAEATAPIDLGIGAEIDFGPGDHTGLEQVYFTTVRDHTFVTLEDWSALAK